MRLLQLILRPAAFVFSLPVIGMSAYVISHNGPHNKPAAIVGYILFCGAGAAVISLVGLGSTFVDALAIPQAGLDLLALLFLLAGAIALAVQTGVASCDPGLQPSSSGDQDNLPRRLYDPGWISNGYTFQQDDINYWQEPYSGFVSRCRMAQASDAFLWFTWGVILVSAVFSVRQALARRSGKGSAV